MRKILFGLIVLLAFFACNDDHVFEQQVTKVEMPATLSRTTASGLGVDKEVLYLQDDSIRLAGELTVSANVPEVSLQWNFPDSCNVDTTKTHLALKNGQAKLDIKWDQILERGNFGPDATAFDGGVLISDGASSIYVHLIWTEEPVAATTNRILTRSASEVSIMPKAIGISLRPAEIKMSAYNGGITRMKLTGVEYTYFQYDRIGAFTNVSLQGLPEGIEGDITRNLEFRWKGGFDAPPANNFKVPFYVIAEDEGINTTAWLKYSIAEDDTLAVTPNELEFNPQGGSGVVTVVTNDEKWEITSQNIPAWIQPGAMEGNKGTSTLSFAVSQNTTMLDRTFTVYLSTTSKSKGIIITQKGIVSSLSVDPQTFNNISANGAAVTLNVTSNTDWSITSTMPAWITPSVHTGNGNGTISFTIAPNTVYQQRTFTMTISAGGGVNAPTQTVVFTQNALAPNNLEVTASSTTIGSQGGVSTLTVTSNTSWSVSSDAAWARVIDATGSANGTSDIVIQENTGTTARVATITVASTAGSPVVAKTITITQQPKNTTVTPGGNVTIGDFQDQNVNVNGGEI